VKAHKFWLQELEEGDDPIDLKIWCRVFLQNGGEIVEDVVGVGMLLIGTESK